MSIIFMTVGLPSSGKSTWANLNAKKLNAIVLSSDQIRKEWYGNESVQGDNNKIFEYINNQAKLILDSGKNVILDATNISQKRRIHFNKEFHKYTRNVIYFSTSPKACIIRDQHRDRVVGEEVIMKMFKALQIPTYAEGWNSVEIIHDKLFNPFFDKSHFEGLLLDANNTHETLFDLTRGLCHFHPFSSIYELPQDNSYHSFSVSRHTYHVWRYVLEHYLNIEGIRTYDLNMMLWVAVLHDIGKACTKSFVNYKGEVSRYANFYGHENASSQLACNILHSLNYSDQFILDVCELVQLHMRLMNAETEKSINKLLSWIGEEKYRRLQVIKEADTNGK